MSKLNILMFVGSAAIAAAVMMHLIPADSPEEQLMEKAIKVETGVDVDLSPNE